MLPPLMKHTLLRTGAIFIGKCIGLVGRILLTRLLGAEGIGLYQIAYSFFGVAIMLITGGLPTVLALFTVNDPARGWIVFRNICLYIVLIGTAFSFMLYMNASSIASLLGNEQLTKALRALAPALLVVPLLQLLRGYMQGIEQYGAISFSEMAEQLVRVALMLTLVMLFLPDGMEAALGAGIIGTTAGALAAFFILLLYNAKAVRFRTTPVRPQHNDKYMGYLIRTSLIIGFTRMLVPASDFIDSILIPRRLQAAGYTVPESIAMYGIITGMALVLAYVPTIVTAALSHTISMKIAAYFQQGQLTKYHRHIEDVMKLAWTWGLISGVFLFHFAEPLSSMIFGTSAAAEPIRYLSGIPLIVGIRELTTSILWIQGRKNTPLTGLIVGMVVSMLLLYFLLAIPGFGYIAAAIGALSLETVAMFWNIHRLIRQGTSLFKVRWIRMDLILFIGASMVIMSYMQMERLTLYQVLCSMFIYWTCGGWIVGLRMRKFNKE
jgi:stage V sporulation protein B